MTVTDLRPTLEETGVTSERPRNKRRGRGRRYDDPVGKVSNER